MGILSKMLGNGNTENEDRTVSVLQECQNACMRAYIAFSAKESGKNLAYLHLKRLQACIEICGATATMLLMRGVGSERLCEICARICEQCAGSCEGVDDAQMAHCVQLCRQAARECLEESHRIKTAAAA